MCTAINFLTKDHYFGRNLDLEYSYDETITITPRNFPFHFRHTHSLNTHFAIIGMSYVNHDYPLYYDGMNEKGLAMAGLHFPGNAVYQNLQPIGDNISPFELIPWVLGQCSCVSQAKKLLSHTVLIDEAFRCDLPLSPLHWIISDRTESIVVEPVKEGLQIHHNPIGVLTNNPVFEEQLANWRSFWGPLPGDWSSPSRFVRSSFIKEHSFCNSSEHSSVNQFFHILNSVEHQRGCVEVKGAFEITVYSSCCNTNKGIYYYRTYENSRIIGIDMHRENLNSFQLASYSLMPEKEFLIQNW